MAPKRGSPVSASQKPSPRLARPRRTAEIFIFALAVLPRFLVSRELGQMPLFRSPQLDSLEYLNWATRIAAGDFRWLEVPAHGPGYPYFLGGLLALFGGSLPAVSAVQA